MNYFHKYLIIKKLPINKMKNIIANKLKYLSINLIIYSPNNFINTAKRKNLDPMANNETKINKTIFRLNKPLAIVINLKGKGVKPAPKTIQKPNSL